MVVAVMLTYYLISPLFDKSIGHNHFILVGIIQFSVFTCAAFLLDKRTSSLNMRRVSKYIDKIGIMIFAILEIIFLIAIIVICVIQEMWQYGVIVMTLMVLVNFATIALVIQFLLQKMETKTAKHFQRHKTSIQKDMSGILLALDYLSLLVGTFIVVGAGGMYQLEIENLAGATQNDEHSPTLIKVFWICDACARLIGGLGCSYFLSRIDGYIIAGVTAFLAAIGFAVVFLVEFSGFV